MSESSQEQAMMLLHHGLPRQGPGSEQTTINALRHLPMMPPGARIYDLGCGPGRASLALARELRQKIVCIDLQDEFLQQLRRSADTQGLSDSIETRCSDMLELEADAKAVNLIWSEGAIYCVGFDRGLTVWRADLANDGIVACSELSWLTDHPSNEPLAFWRKNYPGAFS
jgi:cyclopropane fatty-acyl-phospholipid synthase-like methyltransferase